MRKLKLFTLCALVALSVLPACQQMEPEVFDKPSSTRLSDFLEDIRATLSAEQYGWTMDYFPGSSYAGVTYALSFTNQTVTACVETDPSEVATSTYALKTDGGAVLSFDTYNPVLHAYATPNSSLYQAKGGDFEFEISSFDAQTKTIVMIGKRSRNTITLRPLTKPAEAYFEGARAFEESVTLAAFEGIIRDSAVVGFLDPGVRTISISPKDDETKSVDYRYVVTENSLRLMAPVVYNEVEFTEFGFDAVNEKLLASNIVFDKVTPAGWLSYQQLLGDYTLAYTGGSFTVTMEDDGSGKHFLLAGLSSAWKLPIRYNAGRGRLSFNVQQVGANDTHSFWFCALDAGLNQFSWSTDNGMISSVDDNTKADFTLSFTDDGNYEGGSSWSGWVSFYVTAFKGEPSSSTYDSSALPSDYNFTGGRPYLQGPITMQKIADGE